MDSAYMPLDDDDDEDLLICDGFAAGSSAIGLSQCVLDFVLHPRGYADLNERTSFPTQKTD